MNHTISKILPILFIAGFLLTSVATVQATPGTGDGKILKRSSGETCDACHRTNRNTPSPGEAGFDQTNWSNAIKIHSGETAGTCSNSTYKTKTACTNNGGTWTSRWDASGGWGVTGGRYGKFECTTCHTGHDTRNIYLIKENITAPSGSFPGGATDFRVTSGNPGDPYTMGDDSAIHATSVRICEVCHTYDALGTNGVKQHAFNMGITTTHQNATNCTNSVACHSHKLGFRIDVAAACGDCHGAPPTNNLTTAGSGGLVTSDTAKVPYGITGRSTLFSPAGQGAHQAHKDKVTGTECDYCHHGGMNSYTQGSPDPTKNHDRNLAIGFFGWGSAGNGSYAAPVFSNGYTLIAGPGSGTTVGTGAARTCSSIYCHSSVQGAGGAGAPATYGSPIWDTPSSVVCGNCHLGSADGDPGGKIASGSHSKHVATAQYNMPCANCHNAAGSGAAVHVNNVINVAFDVLYGGSYSGGTTPGDHVPGGGYGTCSTNYCHSDGKAAPSTYANPSWGGAAACGSCHGADDAAPPASAAHAKHVGVAYAYKFSCKKCHSLTVDNTQTDSTNPPGIASKTLHVNTTRDVDLDTAQALVGASATDNGSGVCSSVYCHSSGQGPTANDANPVYAPTNPDWANLSTGACGTCHKTTTGAPLGRVDTGSHTKHLDAAAQCGDCHTGAGDGTAYSSTNHVNTTIEASGAYTAGGARGNGYGTCSTASCHDNGLGTPVATPQWGSAGAACAYCHALQPATASHTKHLTGLSGSFSGNAACGDCHNGAVQGTSFSTGHLDGNLDVYKTTPGDLGYPADAAKGGAPFDSCTTAYCHSNGGGTYRSATWGGASTGCSFCHDARPNTGAHYVHVLTSAAAYGSTAVSSTAADYDFGCGNCHPANASSHANGSVDISFNPAEGGALKSKNDPTANRTGSGLTTVCNKIYCHSNGTAAGLASATTPQWGQTFSGLGGDPCAKCHTNSPDGSTAHTTHVAGIHYDNIYTGTSGLAPSDATNTGAHGNSLYSTTINCNICHNNTVQKARNKNNLVCVTCHGADAPATELTRADLDKRYHVKTGAIDVAFAPINVKSKAQLRDGSMPTQWDRTASGVAYKAAGAYDQSGAALNTASDYNSGAKTCTVSCHNNNSVAWNGTVSCSSCHTEL